jgi:hypothetical protein
MKRIILITLLLAFGITESMFGQINLNFSSGLNYSNCKFEKFEGLSPKGRFGYFIGIAPNYQISEKIQFQVDFQYSLKGFDTGIENNLTPSEFRYGYLDIIPEVEFHLQRYLALGVGLNYGIKINEQVKISNGDWSDPIVETINSTDFGLICKLETNYKNLSGFVRYNIGLKNIAEGIFTDENGQINEDVKQLNRNLQIGIGYKLNFKKE